MPAFKPKTIALQACRSRHRGYFGKMPRWIDVCATADVALDQAKRMDVEGWEIALFHQPDGWFALEDACPHRGGSLYDGFVDEGQVACPIHLWRFRLQDGVCTSLSTPGAMTFPVEVRKNRVWVGLDDSVKPGV